MQKKKMETTYWMDWGGEETMDHNKKELRVCEKCNRKLLRWQYNCPVCEPCFLSDILERET